MAIALQGTPSLYENASATSVVIPYPAGVTAGELLLAHVGHSNATAPTTAPSGWTLLHAQNNSGGGAAGSVFYRIADGTETGSVTIDTAATAGRVTGIMERWSGVDTTTPFDVTTVGSSTGIAATYNSPSITTITPDTMLVYTIIINASTSADYDAPAGVTLISKANGGGGRRTGAYYEAFASTGASGTRTWTLVPASPTLQWTGIVAALRPAAGGGGPVPPNLSQRVVGIPASPSTSAIVSVKTSNATSVRLKAGTDAAVTTGVVWGDPVTPSANGDSKLTISGLTPGTQYYFRVAMTDSAATESLDTDATVGKFKTAPTGAANFAFCFGSCNSGNDTTGVTAIANRQDDLFFHLGDLYYSDGTATTLANFRSKMNEKLQLGQALYATTNISYTPSDHDGFNNNSTAGNDATAWTNWNTVRDELWPMPSSYYAFTWGRVRFIQIDSRSYKSDPAATDNSSKTALGATQKQWFKDEITNATEPVIVVINDAPWIGAAQAGDDGWFGYTTERTELANHMAASGKEIVMIGGDMHALGADNGTNAEGGIYVFQASPLNQTSSIKGGPYSEGTYPTAAGSTVQQYGRCVVTDTGSQIDLAYTGYTAGTNTARITLTKTVVTAPPSTTVTPTGIASAAGTGAPALSATATVAPSGITSGQAVGTPAASSSTSVAPGGIASAKAFGSPSLTSSSQVTPTGVAGGSAVGTPSITTTRTVSPTGIPSAMGLGSPTLSSTSTATPTGIATKKAVGTPALSQDITVSPTGIASAAAVGTPAITVDNRSRPVGIAGAAVVGTPSLSSSTTVRPTGIASKAAAGAPKISMWTVLRPTGIPTKKFVGQPVLRLSSTVRPDGIPSAANLGFPTLVGGGPFKTDYEVTILKKRWKGSIG